MEKTTDNKVTVSVISHGHSALVLSMVDSLASLGGEGVSRFIVTSNDPSLDDFLNARFQGLPFLVHRIDNKEIQGFGTNHNQAFKYCDTEFFCVVNPDIEFIRDPFSQLVQSLSDVKSALAYPSQVDGSNALLDYERQLVSPWAIVQRHLLGQRNSAQPSSPVHWVSGAFMVFKSSVFRELNGFDERYFMYCEDVDMCLRMQIAGYSLAHAEATVIHHAGRRTLKSLEHLGWHLSSLMRLWRSHAYVEYKKKFVDARR